MFEVIQGIKASILPYPATVPKTNTPYLYYGTQPPPSENIFFIEACGLLAANTIELVDVKYRTIRQTPVLFSGNGSMNYDIFSAIFFMVSRYEEYLPFIPDEFGRFPEKVSTSGKFGFTNRPIVHEWVADFEAQFRRFFPEYPVRKIKPTAIFTYDIDVAYAFKGRSPVTQIGSLAKNFSNRQFNILKQKAKYATGKIEDPSDTYAFIKAGSLPKLFFFLWAAQRSKYDRNISPGNATLQHLAKEISNENPVGIHPSFYSSEKLELITAEKNALENTLQQPITQSRQHFLRFRLPNTYRALIQSGILHDYSMQYAEMPGFRAGICLSYPYFDLSKNEETLLMIHPGCIMETTFRDDLHINAANSLDWYIELWEKVKAVGGQFIAIWHNDTLWEHLPDHHPLAFRQIHSHLEQRIKKDLNI